MEARVYERSNRTHFLFLLLLLFGLKWAGMASRTGKKKSGMRVSKKGGQEGKKDDWREKGGTEGEM